MNAEELPPSLNVPDGLNLGSVHGASPVTRDDAPHHFNYAAVPHSDVETSLPRLAAMLNVNRSQANNTYARIRDVQNRKFSKFSEKHGTAAADRKRPSSANRAVVKRHHHQAHQNEVDDLSPRAVPINIANRDKLAKAADPLLHSKGKRSPFNSPRSNEEDKLQALLTLTLKEYYDHHKQPPSLWTKDNDPDLPLIKQLFPINNPGMIRVVTSPTRQSPVNVPGEENLQTGSALEVETRALPELVKTMIFDDEDAQIRHEIQQMQQQQQQQQQQGPVKPKQKLDFKLDQPLARTKKPSAARPHSASGNFDQQRVIHHNYQQQLLQQQQHQQYGHGHGHGQAHGQHPPMLEVQPTNRPDPHAPLAEPLHAQGMVGNKIQPRPHSAQGYNKRPKTAERAARRQRREMEELTKMFQFADLEIRPGANVVAASAAAAAGSRAPSPGAPAPAFHAAMDTEALIPHQQGARVAPSTRQQQPQPQPQLQSQLQSQPQTQPQPQFPPQPTSGPRPHRRVIDLALPFSANVTTTSNADRSRSPSPPPPMTAPALHPPTTTTTIVHHEGASVAPAIDSRRAVQQMAYEIVIQHEKTLLQSGYDVPISVVAPERTDETGSSSSPTRFVPILKDLLPSSLHQEMQRQLQHYKEITGQTLTTPASFQKPVVPLLEVAADIAYYRGGGGGGAGRTSMDRGREGDEEEEEEGLEGISILRPDGQMKKSLKLKWKRFVGHSHAAPQHPWLMPRRRDHATAMDDDGTGGGEGGGSLDEDSSYFITNEVLTSNRSRLPSTGPGESEAVVLPSLSPVGLQPSPGVFGRVVVGGGRPTTAPQDAMLVRLNPNIHSPRLDTPYFPIEQDQLLEHLQWRNKHIVSHSLPGRKLQRPPSANATNAAAAAAATAGAGAGTNRVVVVPSAVPSPAPTRPLSPQDLPQQQGFRPIPAAGGGGANPMTVLDPVQQQQLAAAAAAAAVAVAQHLATMQIPCSSQQIAAIQGAILQGEDMTQALDRILFQPPPSTVAAPGHPLPPSSVSPVMVFPGVEHDGLPPLGTTPASPTALGGDRQVLALQQQSVRPLGFEEKLFTDTGRDAVTLWQQQIYQEQLQQQFQQQQQHQHQQPLDPVLTGRAALLPSHDPVHHPGVSSHYSTKGNKATGRATSPESPLVTERATPRDIATGRVVPLQHVIPVGTAAVSSVDITAIQQDGSHVLQLSARTAGSSGVGVYGTNGEVPVSTTGTKGVSVLQVAAVPLLDAQARPDVRLHEQAKRYGDFINLRNIEQLQTQQQRKQHQQQIEDDEAAAAAAINAVLNNPAHASATAAAPSHTSNQATKSKSPRAHSLHSKLTPRTPTDSARSPHSPHSPGSPLGNRSGEAWKVPDVTPAPPPTMVFHKVPSQPPPGQSFPLLQVTGSGDAIGGGGGGGGGGGPPAHMPSRRPSSSTSRRLSKPLVSPISAAVGGASGMGSSGFTSPFTNMKQSGGTK